MKVKVIQTALEDFYSLVESTIKQSFIETGQ